MRVLIGLLLALPSYAQFFPPNPLRTEPVNAQTGTTYTIKNSDCGSLITFSNSASIAVTLPQAGLSGNFVAGCEIDVADLGVGAAFITPTTSTIAGASQLAVQRNQGVRIVSDGTNYKITQAVSIPCDSIAATCTVPSGSTLVMYAGTFANNQVMGFVNAAGSGNAARMYADGSNNFWLETLSSGNTLNLQSTGGPIAIKGGTNILYRCSVAGTLRAGQTTTVSADCGTAVDTGLRVP